MSSRLMSCHVMSCHVMPCHAMPSHVIPCGSMSCHVMSCHVMSCHVMSCHVMACHVMSCHVMSCGMTRCHLIARQVCRLADYCVMSLIIRYAYNIIICTTVFYSLACRCSTCCFVNAMPCIYFVCVYSQSSWSGSSQLIKTFRS